MGPDITGVGLFKIKTAIAAGSLLVLGLGDSLMNPFSTRAPDAFNHSWEWPDVTCVWNEGVNHDNFTFANGGDVIRSVGHNSGGTDDHEVGRDVSSGNFWNIPHGTLREGYYNSSGATTAPWFRSTLLNANDPFPSLGEWVGSGDEAIVRVQFIATDDPANDAPASIDMSIQASYAGGNTTKTLATDTRARWSDGDNPNNGDTRAPVGNDSFTIDYITTGSGGNKGVSVFPQGGNKANGKVLTVGGFGWYKGNGSGVPESGTVLRYLGKNSADLPMFGEAAAPSSAAKQFPDSQMQSTIDDTITDLDQQVFVILILAVENRTLDYQKQMLRAGIQRFTQICANIGLTKKPLFLLVGSYGHLVTGQDYATSLTLCDRQNQACLDVAGEFPEQAGAVAIFRSMDNLIVGADGATNGVGTIPNGNWALVQAWLQKNGYDSWNAPGNLGTVDLTARTTLLDAGALHQADQTAAVFLHGELIFQQAIKVAVPDSRPPIFLAPNILEAIITRGIVTPDDVLGIQEAERVGP